MLKTIKLVSCILLLCILPSRVFAFDSLSFEVGRGDNVSVLRLGAQWEWEQKWFAEGGWYLGGYWDAVVGYWQADSDEQDNREAIDLGLAPVIRLQQHNPGSLAPYVEAGFGLHIISETDIYAGKDLGSGVLGASHLGLGFRFGDAGRYDLGYRFQHLSNGSIVPPNDGINLHQLRFSYHF